jgi:DNA-binding transcriptional LysR family regulator
MCASSSPISSVSAPDLPTTAWAIYPDRNHVPAKVRAFIDLLRSALSTRAPKEKAAR